MRNGLQVPYFNAGMYLQNKTQIGKVEEIFGCISDGVSGAHNWTIMIFVCPVMPLREFTILRAKWCFLCILRAAVVRAALHNQDARRSRGNLICCRGQVLHRPHEIAAHGALPAPAKGRYGKPRWWQRRSAYLLFHLMMLSVMTDRLKGGLWMAFYDCQLLYLPVIQDLSELMRAVFGPLTPC